MPFEQLMIGEAHHFLIVVDESLRNGARRFTFFLHARYHGCVLHAGVQVGEYFVETLGLPRVAHKDENAVALCTQIFQMRDERFKIAVEQRLWRRIKFDLRRTGEMTL